MKNKSLISPLFHRVWQKRILGISILLLSIFSIGICQVTGTIKDDTGLGIPGVNVYSKSNNAIGTITDIDGVFSLNVNFGDTIVMAYIGYQTQEILIEDHRPLNITLLEDTKVLEEVVVIGYGAVAKKDLTGVVTNISANDFNKGVISSPEALLTGKIAGLQVSSNGEPGGGNRLRIRGGTSLDASSNPLVVIDGIPMDDRGIASGRNPLNFVNTSDIESISVLKDASAAAIYGSRGANGVIMITTKSGKKGKPKVDYSGFFSISNFSGDPGNLSADQFRNAIADKAPQFIGKLGESRTNWVNEVTQAATSMQHNVAISGAKNKTNYYVSLSHLNNDGVLRTSNHKNNSIGINLGTKLLDEKIAIRLKSKTGFTKDQFAPNVIGAALSFDPTQSILDPESPFGGYFQWNDQLATANPVSTLELTDESGETVRSLNSLEVDILMPFVEGLKFTTRNSYDIIDGDKRRFLDPFLKSGDNFDKGGFLFNETLKNTTISTENYFTYSKELPSASSSLDFTLGHSWLQTDQENRWNEGSGLERIAPNGGYLYTTDIKQDSFFTSNRLISFFTRLNYNYNERYLLTMSLRRDGSSRFGLSNQWGLFPAVALGWRILEEDFAQGLNNTFTDLKLRVSWGITGNEGIGDFLFNTFYSFGTDDARYQFGSEYVNTLRAKGVDPGIKWEETSSLNLGVDFGILNNRVSGSIDIYQKNTNDLLFTVATSAFTNLSDRILTNIGEMENRGIELNLNTVIYDRKDFGFNLGMNFAHNRNEIKKLDNSNLPDFIGYETGGISGDIGQQIQILRVGQSTETFLTYQHILHADGSPVTDTEDTNNDGILSPEDMYRDINEDGMINEQDLVINESAAPDFMFGLNTDIRFKNFDFSMTWRANVGNHVYNNVASSTGYFDRLSDRIPNNVDISAFVVNFKEKQLKSDYYIENASFLKLDNITLGYEVPQFSVFKNLRVYGTIQNVLTFTAYSGLDPELPQFTGGIDNNLYPISRTFIFGLNASF